MYGAIDEHEIWIFKFQVKGPADPSTWAAKEA